MVSAIGADIQIIAQLAMKQHRSAFVAFLPEILGRFAARKDRVDPWTDEIGDPVHGICPLWPLLAIR